MDTEIHLENAYFPWNKSDEFDGACWVKGDLFYNNEPLRGSAVLSLISSLPLSSDNDNRALQDLLLNFNGSFAVVIRTQDRILCVVDRVRSIPIFYAKTDDCLIISDDANYLRARVNPPFDEKNGAELLVAGYVTGPSTVFDGLSQIQAGEYLDYAEREDHLTTSFYHQFWHENYYSDSEEELLNRLDTVFVRIFEQLVASIHDQGLQIVVPLSGGLDSRIIVSMLKRCGVDDVICFSYGRRGNRESQISQQVAEALGYRWHFVEYSKDTCNDASGWIDTYRDYGGNLASTPHLQDFFAVEILIKSGKIPKNAVFIPGHSGDMLAGSHIPRVSDQSADFSDASFVQHVLNKHYHLWTWDHDTELFQAFKEKIEGTIADVVIRDKESWANAIELWDYNERQAKFIVNSVRIYEFFKCLWRLPMWDNALIDFFKKIPLHFREEQYLYKKYATERLFVNAFADLGRIECTTPLSADPSPIGLARAVVELCEAKTNFLRCLFSFDIGCAMVWASSGQNYSLVKMKSGILGYRSDAYRDYRIIDEIIVHSQTTKSIPSANGLGAHAYLTHIIG
jgi:asparagine synthase (glutamine-hydrolysing)